MDRIEELSARAAACRCTVKKNELMNRHTTFKVGGPADLFVTVHDEPALCQVIKSARELEIPVLPLGNGSNLLVSDAGFRGCVIALDDAFTKITTLPNSGIRCGASVSLAAVCKFAQRNALSGLEFAWGIPGSVGGAAFMNAGAYGGEMKNVIHACEHVDSLGELGSLSGEKLDLSYRHSAYTDNRCFITFVTLFLEKGDPTQIQLHMEDYYSRRKSKQPLNKPSAGSVFKRPAGHFAGGLIEQCGLKGERVGGAMVSEKHAGFIVNMGGATCRDIRTLIEKIQKTVLQNTGIELVCEVRMVE